MNFQGDINLSRFVNLGNLTTAERTSLGASAVNGSFVYDTDVQAPFWYNGTDWVSPLSEQRRQEVVADIAARDALGSPSVGDFVFVTDASSDATVGSGSALYVYNGSAYVKLAEFESLDFVESITQITLTGSDIVFTNENGTGNTISIADLVSADAGNKATTGTDGKIFVPDTPSAPFVSTIADATTAWGTASGGLYTITVPAATHGKGALPEISLYEGSTSFQRIFPHSLTVNASGDVSITVVEVPDARFIGKIEIR